MILLATVAASAELAGMVAVALGLVKVLEKTYDHKTAKRARENGGNPLVSIRQDVADLKVVAAKQADLSERSLELQERMDRRLEKFAIGQALLLERSSGKSASGERAALGGSS